MFLSIFFCYYKNVTLCKHYDLNILDFNDFNGKFNGKRFFILNILCPPPHLSKKNTRSLSLWPITTFIQKFFKLCANFKRNIYGRSLFGLPHIHLQNTKEKNICLSVHWKYTHTITINCTKILFRKIKLM